MWERSVERCSWPSKWAGSHSNNHQVGQQEPEGTEISGQVLDGDRGRDDEDTGVPRDRRDRRSAPLEDQDARRPARPPSSAASRTFVANGAPASPPPARRAPIVVTPVVSASSR